MAFSWSSLQAGDPIENTDFNEIKTNLESIYTYLGLTPDPAWTAEWPLEVGDPMKSAHPQELRDKTDYADNNFCSVYNATVDTTVRATHNSTVRATHNSTVRSGYDSTVYSGQNNTVRSGYNSSAYSGEDTSVRSSNNSGVYSGQKTTAFSVDDGAVYGSQNSTVQGNHNSTYTGPA